MLNTRKKLFLSITVISFVVVLTLAISLFGYNLISQNVSSIKDNNDKQAVINQIHNQSLRQQLGQYEIIINNRPEDEAKIKKINDDLKKIIADYRSKGELSEEEQGYLASIEANNTELLKNFEEKILPEVKKNKREEIKANLAKIGDNTSKIYQYEYLLRKNITAAINEEMEKALGVMRTVDAKSKDIASDIKEFEASLEFYNANLNALKSLDPSKESDKEEIVRITDLMSQYAANIQRLSVSLGNNLMLVNSTAGSSLNVANSNGTRKLESINNLSEWSGRLYSYLLEGSFVKEGEFAKYNEASAKTSQYIKELIPLLEGENRTMASSIETLHKQSMTAATAIISEISKTKNSSILDNNKYSIAVLAEIDAAAQRLSGSLNQYISEGINKSKELQLSITIILSVIIIISISIGALLAATMKNIMGYIKKTARVLDRAEAGDLSVRPEFIEEDGEMGELAKKVSGILDKHKRVADDILNAEKDIDYLKQNLSNIYKESRDNISSISRGYYSTVNTIKGSMKNLKDPAANVGKLIEGVKNVSEVTEKVVNDGMRAIEIAASSGRILAEIEATVKKVTDTVATITGSIKQLEQVTRKVGDATSEISEIATKTNLLAMNASFEAENMPEHGGNYAAIAKEITKLADGSSQAANDVNYLVEKIQSYVYQLIDGMSSGVHGVEESVIKINEVKTYIEDVVYSVKIVVDAIRNTTEDIKEHMASTDDVASAIGTLSKSVLESTADSEYISRNIEEQARVIKDMEKLSKMLEETSNRLDDVTEGYKIYNEYLNTDD